ncbi:MAG: hypothetical protein HY000_19305 [Planctomycetes bacterium]|nr:hypothetical protein [Planctomycetota bacterium]
MPTNTNSLIVEPATRGIKNVLVYARKVPRVRPLDKADALAAEGHAVLEIKDHTFNPRILALRLYQLLRIRNRDPVAHIFLLRPPLGVEANILLGPGDEIDHSFPTKQYFPVVVNCSFHPWMTAYVLLRDDPYFALADDYGWFEIRDLPAGEEIEFQVWHELGRGPNGSLEARPEWLKGRFRVAIPRGGVLDLGTIEIAPAAFRLESRGDASRTLPDSTPR